MAQMSNYLENALVNHVFRNTPFTTPGVVHMAIFSSDPGEDASGTELESGTSPGYARKTFTLGAPTDGVASNDAEILFAAATGDWVAATHIAVFDEATGGNMLMYKALPSSVSVLNTNNFRIPVGDFQVTFA